jgi:hypothetical protein
MYSLLTLFRIPGVSVSPGARATVLIPEAASWLGPAKSVKLSQVWYSRVRSDGRSVDGTRSTARRQHT